MLYIESKEWPSGRIPADKEHLYRMYWEEKLTLRQMASRLKVCRATVLRAMKELGIPRRKALIREDGHAWNWKGGRSKGAYGYILIYSPGHPKANSSGHVHEHTLVWEKAYGELPKG